MKPRVGFAEKSKSLELRKADSRTMAILTVLLATRMVLRSFSGILYNLITLAAFFDLDVLSFSMSSGLREKKATSEPEIRADETRSSTRMEKPVIRVGSGVCISPAMNGKKKAIEYAGSKIQYIKCNLKRKIVFTLRLVA